MKGIFLYIWCLPQNLLGLALRLFYKGNDSIYEDAIVRRSTKMLGGISLGKYIIVNQWSSKEDVKHEYGHCIQSKKWGWLYLPVVGLSSLIWAWLYGPIIDPDEVDYYSFWTEKNANKLGNVKR